jgi:hypothetical protein
VAARGRVRRRRRRRQRRFPAIFRAPVLDVAQFVEPEWRDLGPML